MPCLKSRKFKSSIFRPGLSRRPARNRGRSAGRAIERGQAHRTPVGRSQDPRARRRGGRRGDHEDPAFDGREALNPEFIVPSVFDRSVVKNVAAAVSAAAVESGVGRRQPKAEDSEDVRC